ncbi:MAG TPA: aminopeptidase P N-terminal domain-containing protein [Gemmatimonadaceae bacterium]
MRLTRLFSLLSLAAAPALAQITQAEYAARRTALSTELPGDGIVVVTGAPEPKHDYDVFTQDYTFNYLTGFLEPDAALVIVHKGGNDRALLFVQPKDPSQEVWTGKRLGVAGVGDKLGLEGRDATTLHKVIDSLKAANTGLKVLDATAQVAHLRGTKSPAELELLRTAARISAMAHNEVLHAIAPGMAEFEIQALAEYTFRRNGADGPAYGSIVGSGPNSTTLHYNANDRFMQSGDVLNMDMAASYGGYSADLTRTVPVNGRYSPEQREIYQIVYDAQQAGERQVKAGAPVKASSDSATAVIKAGLARLGLIESADAKIDGCAGGDSCFQYRLYYMHALSHPIGLDVHDVDQLSKTGHYGVGSAFTIEPGIYVRENTLDIIPHTPRNAQLLAKIAPAVRKYANIGVRIEDDYIVTAAGFDRITSGAPREMDEIEREMAVRAPLAGRDSTLIESYKKIRP